MVRTCLLQRINGRHGRAIVITSATEKAGKTTVATMLAKSIAECGKKVLLVDGDLRNPAASRLFGLEQCMGLLELLSARAADIEVIVANDTPGLSILPAGRSGENTYPELLANGAFAECLSRWQDRYDLIILDSSPVLPVADARIISRYADGVVMVVREGRCQRSNIVEALASLGAVGGKLLGIVYVGSSRHKSYRYHYYNYQNNPTRTENNTEKKKA